MTKFFLDQRGCAKNQVDGEVIISNLLGAGFEEAASAEEADLIIINSCGFIESAKKESLDALLGARKKYKDKKIILAGCLAQRYAKIFKEDLPEADGIFGNGDLSRVASFAKKIMAGKRDVLTPKQAGVSCGQRLKLLSYKNSAYVKITEGCSNHCSFCAIPLIRGELRSRPAADIVAEIKALLKQGVFEINLIGQDLAAYGTETDGKPKTGAGKAETAAGTAGKPKKRGGLSPLASLLKKISAIKGGFWVRLLYIHPDHFNPDILEVLKKDARILPYFDIPFQSGDDDIIRSMNRKNSASYYKELVKNIRAQFPDAALRTTFLAGFPGEKEEAAQHTLDFLKSIEPDWSGAFAYSKEEDTAAFSMKGQVPKKTAAARVQALQAAQEEITQKRLAARVRKNKKYLEYDVLVEEIIDGPRADKNLSQDQDAAYAIGRAWFQAPEVDGNIVIEYDADDPKAKAIKPGSVVKVRAVAVSGVDIYAEAIS
ncbi:MAG: 30S ribosomal protein S12 methylthiotransferase RimO [Treponema sp.]|nr:30S ribosomal protein S12 methylthiotransferase RimO [Treponema sp.]